MTTRAPAFQKNDVIKYPADILHRFCECCDPKEDHSELIAKMFAVLDTAPGIGLSASQLGVPKRIIVVDLGKGDRFVMLNPEIVKRSKATMINDEGCLSFPGKYVPVQRAQTVTVQGFDENWKPIQRKAKKLLSMVLQHEIDHINGITIAESEWKRAA